MDVQHISEPSGSSGIGRFLRGLTQVKPGEALTVALLSLNCLILLTCYYVLKVVREPLILLGGGAELKAYASAGQTLLLLGVVPAFGWLSNRVSRIRLMTTMQLIFIGCLVAFYVLAQAKAPIGLAFYLWLGIFNVLVVSNFWSFANDLYTEQEGKRLFATIGVGASIGAILGAFVPHLLHATLGIHGLMLVAVGGLGVSILLYQVVDRRERARTAAAAAGKAQTSKPEEVAKSDKKGGFKMVIKDRYLFVLALMLLVATVINTSGEYVIGKMATDRSEVYATEAVAHAPQAPSRDATSAPPATPVVAAPAQANDLRKAAQDEYISKFYSDYYTVVNLLSALLQGLLVGRIMMKLGVRRALFIMPLVVLGGWFALILLYALHGPRS